MSFVFFGPRGFLAHSMTLFITSSIFAVTQQTLMVFTSHLVDHSGGCSASHRTSRVHVGTFFGGAAISVSRDLVLEQGGLAFDPLAVEVVVVIALQDLFHGLFVLEDDETEAARPHRLVVVHDVGFMDFAKLLEISL